MRSPGGGELSLSACPGVGNRPPRKKKIANSRGCARGGMVTGRIEPCISLAPISPQLSAPSPGSVRGCSPIGSISSPSAFVRPLSVRTEYENRTPRETAGNRAYLPTTLPTIPWLGGYRWTEYGSFFGSVPNRVHEFVLNRGMVSTIVIVKYGLYSI